MSWSVRVDIPTILAYVWMTIDKCCIGKDHQSNSTTYTPREKHPSAELFLGPLSTYAEIFIKNHKNSLNSFANKHDRQTNKQTPAVTLPPPLVEVIILYFRSFSRIHFSSWDYRIVSWDKTNKQKWTCLQNSHSWKHEITKWCQKELLTIKTLFRTWFFRMQFHCKKTISFFCITDFTLFMQLTALLLIRNKICAVI